MGETMPRYKCKSIAALYLPLGGLPDKMRVEVDANIRLRRIFPFGN
jgi:hypothetical protein